MVPRSMVLFPQYWLSNFWDPWDGLSPQAPTLLVLNTNDSCGDVPFIKIFLLFVSDREPQTISDNIFAIVTENI